VRGLLREVRHAARALRRAPALSLAAVVTLALGIGATTAIFSVVSAVLLRPLPYPDSDRLLAVWVAWEGSDRSGLSPAEYLDYRASVPAFRHLGIWAGSTAIVSGEEPRTVQAAYASADLFPALGVAPALGRTFTAEEDRPSGDAVAVVSHGFWRTWLGGSPDAVGRRIVVDGEPRTIVGVMPAGFALPGDVAAGQETQLYLPTGLDPALIDDRGSHFLSAVARLRPGVSPAEALGALRTRAAASVAEFPDDYPEDMRFTAGGAPLREDVLGAIRRPLLLLLGAVTLLLLVACANVAGLLLSRGEERRRELAVRAALGASRIRLTGAVLVESVLLSLVGGAAGVALALWGTETLLALRPAELPSLGEAGVDARVLAFALAAALFAGVACGLAPAASVVGRGLADALGGGRGDLGRPRQRLRGALVVAQVAVTLVLLAGAGLLARSLAGMLAVDPGYATRGVLAVQLGLPSGDYAEAPRVLAFYRDLLPRLRGLPGVLHAGAVSNLPLETTLGDLNFEIEGRPVPPGARSPAADWQVVTPGYFEAMGIPVLRGRSITDADHENAPGAVVINERMAREHWPGEDPLGRRFTLGGGAGPGVVEVVGVAGDVRHAGLDAEPRPEMYLPHAQFRFWDDGGPLLGMDVVIRSAADPAELTRAIAREVHAVDPGVPVDEVQTIERVVAASVAGPRFAAILAGSFSVLALVLAGVGLYGLVAYAAARRVREVGLRIAVGARGADVVRLLVGEALRLVGLGLVAGLPAALLGTRLLERLLFGVAPGDPLTLGAVAAVVIAVGAGAGLVPAARAARIPPLRALQAE
jgi:putative ABC transport system permease protein